MSQSCSQLVPKLKHLQTLQGDFQVTLARYLQTGTDADKAKLEQLKQAIEIAKNEYERASLVKVEWVNKDQTKHQIIAKQVIILEYIKKQIGGFKINSNQYGEVELFDINNNGSAAPIINEALKFTNKLNGLLWLYCHNNPLLSELPELPNSLQALDCSNNPQLSELPELPDSLQVLDCSNNPQLSELPELPDSLQVLDCYNNSRLSKLPELPDSITFIDIRNTLAAQDLEVIAKLEEFKTKHPTAQVLY
ncbi:MAG: hypothetical protein A2538_03360 [Candidatus Magasanikbacteria bacterium RIFOXYD2_FULL_41_14]|uniref:Uncharacterized protein n=1 Tax=Candidatus Magasanikbacteria bacterium RIFOXYD2_FULL_41_14 TaxID=1798709 RepID=A0A1F6PGY1_9BACT|nr:MAG: hypothetical protein A2538_03360 [Candidatus Magasanikbacteria bacterium RIFOXYD2_FULL_41_14]